MGRAPGLTLRVHFANRIMQKHLELSRPGLMPSLATLMGQKSRIAYSKTSFDQSPTLNKRIKKIHL